MFSPNNIPIEELFSVAKSQIQMLRIPAFQARGIRLLVKRDDLIHPEVSGNKWRKLKYPLLQALQQKSEGIMTFGGAYSNHLLATASVCNEIKLPCVGFIRGEELAINSNPTLSRCHQLGMKLVFLPREEYALRNDFEYQRELKAAYPAYFLIPEGGASYLGMIGCQEIWKEITEPLDHLFVAQGTTTTSCGLLLAKPSSCTLHVVPVLKGFDVIQEMTVLLNQAMWEKEMIKEALGDLVVHADYHFGGYAKYNDELLTFIQTCANKYDLPLDQVYTGKAFYAVIQELEKKLYDGQTILFLHTGGLQGKLFNTSTEKK